jgi:hypothetical protein
MGTTDYSIAAGSLVNGNTITGVTLASAGSAATATVTTPGPVYPISISAATGSGLDNYTISYDNTATLTITTRPITVTVKTGQFKYCGQSNPVYDYTYTVSGNGVGLASGDAFAGSLTRVAGESVGNFDILQADLSIVAGSIDKTGNYKITYQSAPFEIKGVTIDASASGNSYPLGSPAKVSATVYASNGTTPVSGVLVTFTLTTTGGGVAKTITATSNSAGVAESLPFTGLTVNLYKVVATSGCENSIPAYLSVYDPNAGFVTGGGWIMSPLYAYAADPTLTGKANFGFNAQYKKGSNAVDGNTEFQFTAGNLNFKSSNYSAGTLVISGAKATFRGTGTINGTGTYSFMVSGIDGTVTGGGGVDKFRIKIWGSNGVVYDNNMGNDENGVPTTALGGGSIVIHDNSKKTVTAARVDNLNVEVVPIALKAYPNPSTNKFTVNVQSSNREEKIQVRVMDLNGRVVEMFNNLSANQTLQIGSNYRPGMYIVEMIQGNERKQLKLIKQAN